MNLQVGPCNPDSAVFSGASCSLCSPTVGRWLRVHSQASPGGVLEPFKVQRLGFGGFGDCFFLGFRVWGFWGLGFRGFGVWGFLGFRVWGFGGFGV